MTLTAVLLFIRTNWKYIVGLIAFIVAVLAVQNYLDSVYNDGRKAGIEDTTKTWKEKYDRDIGVLNKKISDVESASRHNAELAKLELETANSKLTALQEELKKQRAKYDSYVYDRQGKVVCKTDTPIFLGPDFSTKWNELNRATFK